MFLIVCIPVNVCTPQFPECVTVHNNMCQSRATHKHNHNNGGNAWRESAITTTHGINNAALSQRSNDMEHTINKICNNLYGQVKNIAQL